MAHNLAELLKDVTIFDWMRSLKLTELMHILCCQLFYVIEMRSFCAFGRINALMSWLSTGEILNL